MDHPYFHKAGTITEAAGSIAPPWPTHAIDDIALLLVESDDDITLADAQGFALVAEYDGGGLNTYHFSVYWCRATSGAMSAPTVAAGGDHRIGQILVFRNCITSDPPYVGAVGGLVSTGGAVTGYDIPGSTTTTDLALAVICTSNGLDGTAGSNILYEDWANVDLISLFEITDQRRTAGDGGGFGAAAGIKLTAGAFGITAVTTRTAVTDAPYVTLAFLAEPEEVAAEEDEEAVIEPTTATGITFDPGVDLELDDDGDLVVDSDAHFTQGLAAVKQEISIRTQMFEGEWFLDLDFGVPYFQDILGQKFSELKVRAAFRDAILSAPHVDSLTSLAVSFNRATRIATVTWKVESAFGTVSDSVEV